MDVNNDGAVSLPTDSEPEMAHGSRGSLPDLGDDGPALLLRAPPGAACCRRRCLATCAAGSLRAGHDQWWDLAAR
eukprot:10960713-Alexandrium_andersonii.AAC.1